MRPHHRFGCLKCGSRRKKADIISKVYDIYMRDETSGSLMRVGLCGACFADKDNIDADELKRNLEKSETDFCKENGKPVEMAQTFMQVKFIGRMGHDEYWNEVRKKKPKLANEFIGIIKDERNRDHKPRP